MTCLTRFLLGVLNIRWRHDVPAEESSLEEPDTSAHPLTDPAQEGTTL